ncbi:pimeloyl-ACP methyl ester carboxylesterase [Saccharothrix tamanrassetensis]|uniref:Pimeloyl-ACP methyl ester carboxylesterase n=1 Tax=Saccharothrix tamanrassetensis TaxID=1051531 RepID=A0A841CL33_9PSEU|nr:alpha/beta fold hydrolase [Saccharothrix tamanrassetensis]MBB5956807.1 pimeloyl-ACP methyl ester carboxylesterase [Saccharothrix tamanrassetensis]
MTSALLLAHGAGGTVRANFSPVIPALARKRPVFSVDFPGSGTTPRATEPLELDDLADRLVDAAGGAARFAVLGYSMGCAVAVRAALRYPERVSALVLTAGFVRIDDETRARTEKWRRLLGGDRRELARFIMSVVLGEPFRRAMTPEQEDGFLEIVALTLPTGVDEQVDLVQRIDLTADLPRLAVPTLVIGTKHDRLITPASTRALADAIPGARWAELDSGHAPALEAPAEWTRLIDDFLS